MLTVLLTLIAAGVLLYLVGLIPMDRAILQVIRVVVIVAVLVWLAHVTGLTSHLPPMPRW